MKRSLLLDRAVAFAVAGRVWLLLSGPVTLLMISRHLTLEAQGFYYTFGSLLALQSFVELGFYYVIINVASHEWSQLTLDTDRRIVGDPAALSRLVSLGRLVFKWYGAASLIFLVVVSSVGFAFFARAGEQTLAWKGPWLVLVLLTSVQLSLLPFTALLEGCNQVATVNKFRLFQAVGGSLALWLIVASGGGLWACVAMASARLAADLSLYFGRYPRFFSAFRHPLDGPRVAWRTEVWPMQWRLALSGVVHYFAFSLFNPVMFRYHGPAVAGQMGMTLQIAGGIQSLSLVWITARVPTFGMLIANRDYPGLKRLWLRASLSSVALAVTGGVAVGALAYLLNTFEVPLAGRLLSPLPVILLLVATVLMQVSHCLTAYMRAHKKEPIVVMSVTTSLLTGASVWFLGSRFGAIGAASAYVAVMAVLVVWEVAIWRRFVREVAASEAALP